MPGVDVGSIDAAGLYTAPSVVPYPGSVLVRAETVGGATATATVFISSATADGSFIPKVVFDRGQFGYDVADLNADGIPDILNRVSGGGFNTHDLLPGLGDGTFGPPQPRHFVGKSGRDGRVFGDLNGDGFPDLVGMDASKVFEDGNFHITLTLPDGSFDTANTQSRFVGGTGSFQGPRDAVIADFNGDGVNDIAVVEGLNDAVHVFLNSGSGTFPSASIYSVGADNPFRLETADLDADGRLDLVVASRQDLSISVLLNEGGVFGTPQVLSLSPGGSGFPSFELGDLNNDGLIDLFTSGTGAVESRTGNGDGTFGPPHTPIASGNLRTLGHFNADGNLDVILDAPSGAELWLGDGAGGFTFHSSPSSGLSTSVIEATELNGDGNYDLLVSFFDGSQFLLASLLGGPGVVVPVAVQVEPSSVTVNVEFSQPFETKVFGTLDNLVE